MVLFSKCFKSVYITFIYYLFINFKYIYIFLDIYGILKFLDVCPYNDRKQFIQLIKGEASFMYEWLSKLIWRNFIHDVNSELEIPEQTLMRHWLTFSQIEKHFYQTQHADCATTFLDIINK